MRHDLADSPYHTVRKSNSSGLSLFQSFQNFSGMFALRAVRRFLQVEFKLRGNLVWAGYRIDHRQKQVKIRNPVIARIGLKGCGLGIFETTLLEIDHCERVIHIAVVSRFTDGLHENAFGLIESSLDGVGLRKVHRDVRSIAQGHCTFEGGFSALEIAELPAAIPELIQRRRVLIVETEGILQVNNRLSAILACDILSGPLKLPTRVFRDCVVTHRYFRSYVLHFGG